MAQRIIDHDINFYGEHDAQMLRRCWPEHEPYWKARVAASIAVRDALIALRDLVDNPPAGCTTTLER
jgi:hypothetical protein